jgi:hypothetical protein
VDGVKARTDKAKTKARAGVASRGSGGVHVSADID